MASALWLLVIVMVIAGTEIWQVLAGIREALKAIAGANEGYEGGALQQVARKLDAAVGELDRIGGILGGILASMPSSPPKPEPRSDWDKLRAQLAVEKPGSK